MVAVWMLVLMGVCALAQAVFYKKNALKRVHYARRFSRARVFAGQTVELIEVDRRRLVFSAEVRDPFGVVASGTHERFVVDNAKFMEKARRKLRSD